MESHHLSSERDNSMTKNDSISHDSSQNASAALPVVFIAGSLEAHLRTPVVKKKMTTKH